MFLLKSAAAQELFPKLTLAHFSPRTEVSFREPARLVPTPEEAPVLPRRVYTPNNIRGIQISLLGLLSRPEIKFSGLKLMVTDVPISPQQVMQQAKLREEGKDFMTYFSFCTKLGLQF